MSLVLMKNEQGHLLLRERGDDPLNELPSFIFNPSGLRIRNAGGPQALTALVLIPVGPVEPTQPAESFIIAVEVSAAVDGDPVNPRRKKTVSAEFSGRLVDFEKNLLGDVLGTLAVVEQGGAEVQDFGLIAVDENLQSDGVFAGYSPHQLAVGHPCWRHVFPPCFGLIRGTIGLTYIRHAVGAKTFACPRMAVGSVFGVFTSARPEEAAKGAIMETGTKHSP